MRRGFSQIGQRGRGPFSLPVSMTVIARARFPCNRYRRRREPGFFRLLPIGRRARSAGSERVNDFETVALWTLALISFVWALVGCQTRSDFRWLRRFVAKRSGVFEESVSGWPFGRHGMASACPKWIWSGAIQANAGRDVALRYTREESAARSRGHADGLRSS